MEFHSVLCVTVSVIFFASEVTAASGWDYHAQHQWPGACRVGVAQSPINIDTQQAVLDRHGVHLRGPLRLSGYDDVAMEAVNNGHTLKWSVKYGSRPVISGGPLRSNYTLLQFHLHWLSEHAINSLKYPMEIHFVHVKQGLSLARALELPDGLAVVAVLGQVDNRITSQYAIQQLMHTVPSLLEKTSEPVQAGDIDISNFLSPNPQSYYTYQGSLTTPDCNEAVTWIVMDKPIFISDLQYNLITKTDVGGPMNYRSLQPVNRVVYRSAANCLSLAGPSLLVTLGTIAKCLSLNTFGGLTNAVMRLKDIKKKLITGKSA